MKNEALSGTIQSECRRDVSLPSPVADRRMFAAVGLAISIIKLDLMRP
jgi:hypothetical protein